MTARLCFSALRALRLSSTSAHVVRRNVANSRSPLIRQFSRSCPSQKQRYVRFDVDPEQPLNVRKWDLGTQIFVAVVVGGGVYYVTHLEQIPETGRWRFMDINPKFEAKLAKASHDELLAEFRGKVLPENHPVARHVRRVVTRILESSNLGTLSSPESTYLPTHGASDDLWSPQTQTDDVPPGAGGRQWNLMVVNDDRIVNAAASYGNIVVFTGILPAAKDEQGLAAVLGHEIGHVVLRHNSERYSSMKVLLALATALEVAGLDLGIARLITSLLYDLPNSRTQELEADQVGLKLAAKACFDPQAAPEMFTRLGQLEKRNGGRTLSFISTHPPSEQRVKRLEGLLADAYAIRAASPECSGIQDSMAAFRDSFALSVGSDGNTWR
ncbi:hypothetical protein POSPLADRAFT_1181049 [Postia placenta MAD-698-R-SB12]|uniref:Peptidase M48 domain-containing protein n=1 Tax=Postia placenta MAD-698-R-SB12 TaxID=670580 RepID=A0A1X6N3C1_9APHY|nr:hypothetical protein POSPLADRAFT_1181049 [Postia placenta MAD-698-R-SB12]OSX62976.1 hypothetical protein POSPLADRAFT_1181049 [Postia placenta MAD-698-R-SB12]